MKKRLTKFLIGAASLVVALSLSAGAASADPAGDEGDFVARLNDLRASQGLSTLSVDPALTDMARAWSAQMAAAGGISHNPSLATQAPSDWVKLGENVGVGPTVVSLHDAFVASPDHYRNMIDPAFQKVGVGVVQAGEVMYVTVDFMASNGQVVSVPVGSVAAAAAPAKVCKTRKCRAATRRRIARRRAVGRRA